MKKFLYILLGVIISFSNTVSAYTVFYSGQVGASPTNRYVLQTDGTNSTWVATSTLGLGSGSTYSASYPITLTGTTFGFAGLSTTSQPSSSNLLVSNGSNGVYGVATSTLTPSSPLTGSFVQIGSGGSLGCQTASGSQAGCLSSTDWTTFNNKENALTFLYPLTRSTNTISLAFGTSTSNTWGGTQAFTNTANFNTWTNNGSATTTNLAITSLTGLLVGNGSTKPLSVAVSGTDIKTINGSSILGSGDLTVTASAGLGTTTPWTVGQLAMVSSNGSVTSISTSTLVNQITPFTSYGISTSSIFGLTGGFFSTASSTMSDLKVTGTLSVPNNTAPILGSAGQIALDTTSNDLVFATSTSGSIIIQSATSTLFSLNGTTTAITSGLVQKRPPFSRQTVVTDVGCAVTSGTSLQLYISDGTNNSNTITCTTTYTYYSFTTNNVFSAGTNVQVVWGTKTGDTGDVISSFNGYQIKN